MLSLRLGLGLHEPIPPLTITCHNPGNVISLRLGLGLHEGPLETKPLLDLPDVHVYPGHSNLKPTLEPGQLSLIVIWIESHAPV